MQNSQIIGRIGADAEIREATSGNTVINFNVAVSEKWKDKNGEKQEKTTWYRCSWWLNNTSIAPYLSKGTQVFVSGKSNANAYTNKDGELVVQEGINVRSLELLGGGSEKGASAPSPAKKSEPQSGGDVLPFSEEEERNIEF